MIVAGLHRTSRTCGARSRPTPTRRVGACFSPSAAKNRWRAVSVRLALARLSSLARRDPRDPRNRKLAGTRPDSYKKERSRLEQASGHKGLPNAERRRRRVSVGIVIVLVRVARGVCVCVVCVDVALVSLCAPLYLPLVASRLSTNPSCGTCVSRRSRAARCIGSAPFVRPRRRCWR